MYNHLWAEDFLNQYEGNRVTQMTYRTPLTHFHEWMKAEGITEPTEACCVAYGAFLSRPMDGCKPFSAGTQNRYMRVLKQYSAWLSKKGLYEDFASEAKKAKVDAWQTKKEAFSEEEIKAILTSIDRSTLTGKRDYAIILLSVTAGLRLCEMQRADVSDIQTVRGQKVLYIQGKGHQEKDAKVKLIPEVSKAIEEYLEERKAGRKEPLFTSNSNRGGYGRMTTSSLSVAVKERFRQAGFDSDRLTAHSLRHTSNTVLFKAGADLYQVQKHARHSDPKVTEIYLHMSNWESDRSEEQVYTQIFAPERQRMLTEVHDRLADLTAEELAQLISFMDSLKKEKVVNFR